MVLMNYFQGRNGDTDVENRLADAVGQGESGTNAASSINIYILLCVRQTAGEKLLCSTRSPIWCSVMVIIFFFSLIIYSLLMNDACNFKVVCMYVVSRSVVSDST